MREVLGFDGLESRVMFEFQVCPSSLGMQWLFPSGLLVLFPCLPQKQRVVVLTSPGMLVRIQCTSTASAAPLSCVFIEDFGFTLLPPAQMHKENRTPPGSS